MNIAQIVKDNDIKQIFRAFATQQYDVELYRALSKESLLKQYYILKSVKEYDIGLIVAFAEKTRHIDNRQMFRDILTMYGENEDDLRHCHKVKDGLPRLAHYHAIALTVF